MYALTGGQDALIHAFDVAISDLGELKVSHAPRYSLLGHAGNVSSLRAYGADYIVSGSWDNTVRVWRAWTCVATLSAHTHAVWSVLPLDADRVLSASADKSVCLWSLALPQRPIATFSGASQAVRDLARLDDVSFAAAGNDGTIRVYALDGAHDATPPQGTIATLPAFVYALAAHDTELASSGEDRAVHVWADGALRQRIDVPALSVWCVCALSNGDLACGASDGIVRVFTRASERRAPADAIAVHSDAVATQSLSFAEIEGIAPQERSALNTPGASEGTVCVVRDGSRTERFHWHAGEARWSPTGVVTEGAAPASKQMHNGRAYDYVFDVDVQDGVPPLKLPYNVSENTYVAASRFLEENHLPVSYLDQVVGFLEKNTRAVGIAPPAASADPYTGDSQYVPSAAAPRAPAPAPAAAAADPFTGGDALTSATPALQTLPQTKYLSFTQANLPAALSKLQQLSREVPGASLRESDAAALERLVAALEKPGMRADPSVLLALLPAWPIAARFPLLDLLRIAAAHAGTVPVPELATAALVGADWDALEAPGVDAKAGSTNAMLALRVLANAFVAPNGATSMDAIALEALATLRHPPWAMLNKHGRTALATVAYNYSVYAQTQPFAHTSFLLEVLIEVLSQDAGSEAAYRALVALGNLLCTGAPLPPSLRSRALERAEACRTALREPRIDTVCNDLVKLA